jgi:drug/metabolite transporter (DMT)-like permease
MHNLSAFITVLIVWSTTPLAIKIASMGSSAFFAAFMRMALAVIICYLILHLKQQKLAINKHKRTYSYAGGGIFITLSLVYISAQYIDSGIIAIIFALTPIITGIIANILLQDNAFNLGKMFSAIIAFIGITLLFVASFETQLSAVYLLLLVIAMSFQAFISVKLKHVGHNTTALQTTTGGLLFSLAPFFLSFLLLEPLPEITTNAIIATIYLAIFGSVFGFISYYYLIKNSSVLTVAIIPLITPIFALVLGSVIANEMLNTLQFISIIIVFIALIFYQFGDKLVKS